MAAGVMCYKGQPLEGARELACGGAWYVPRLAQQAGLDIGALERAAGNTDVYLARNDVALAYRGKPLARSKAFVNLEHDAANLLPLYVYTGFQYRVAEKYLLPDDPRVVGFVPALAAVAGGLAAPGYAAPGPYNQAIVTNYLNESDYIGWHSDKMRSIAPHTLIVDFSLGATRTFTLCVPTFQLQEDKHGKKVKTMVPTQVESVDLHSGDALVLSTDTNARTQHAVLAQKRPVGPRQSVVFRTIQEVVSRAQVQHRIARANYRQQ